MSSRKFQGYAVRGKGIDLDRMDAKAIEEMEPLEMLI